MDQYHHQNNYAPAVPLDSADYLTNKKTISEYEQIQHEHLHRPSIITRFANRPAVRRLARDSVRLIMLMIALCIAGALLYYLEHDASLATGNQ